MLEVNYFYLGTLKTTIFKHIAQLSYSTYTVQAMFLRELNFNTASPQAPTIILILIGSEAEM